MRVGGAWLTFITVLLIARAFAAQSQPLGANPSAAPSELGNSSSINPAARSSDIGNPSAMNPSAAATQQSPAIATGPSPAYPESPRVRLAPMRQDVERWNARKRRAANAPAEEAPSCKAGKVR